LTSVIVIAGICKPSLTRFAIIFAIGGFERNIAPVTAATTQPATASIEILPVWLSELSRMGHRPDTLAHNMVPGPGFCGQHQPIACEWQRRIPGRDQASIDIGSHLPGKIVAIEIMGKGVCPIIIGG
jgi:hypothetical protein